MVFYNASERDYGVVLYLQLTRPDGKIVVSLLGGKTEMTPMSSIITPKLEFCTTVLLARWISRIQETIGDMLIVNGVFAWSDSQIALS